jgi:hypothetical protein
MTLKEVVGPSHWMQEPGHLKKAIAQLPPQEVEPSSPGTLTIGAKALSQASRARMKRLQTKNWVRRLSTLETQQSAMRSLFPRCSQHKKCAD